MSETNEVRLAVRLDPEVDPERGEQLVGGLRRDLAELDVVPVAVEPARPVPEGAKAADAVTVGAVVVALSASGGVLTTLLATLRDWLDRQSGRHRIAVTLNGETIELERATGAQQQELVAAFLRRHTDG